MSAQTDVTSTYLTNANFSSTEGWVQYKSGTTLNIGSGLIGTFKPTGNTAATVDATHLNTEYCIGMQNRWNTVASAYQQTTPTLPVGYYELSFDVEDVNSSSDKINYDNLFYVEVGGVKYTDSSTEWMTAGKSSWTTHTVSFNVEEESTATISLGYGNLENSNKTPIIYVCHLKLTYTDPAAAANAAKLEAAKYTLNGYIKKATALNGVLNDENLATAINTAQGVYDNADDYTEDYDNTVQASTILSTAITTALSGATVVSLSNGNFDTDINIAADGTNSGTMSSTATSAKPYIWEVTGWTTNFTFNSTASQGNTAVYGAACSGTNGTNGTNSPATDMFGGTDGGTLHLSSGWSDQARYKQVVESLPAGRYVFYYEANNQNRNATTINSNYFGVSGTAGDFYGTTNAFVYSEAKTFAYNTWTANAFEFDVAQDADVTFNVGVVGTTSGSANGAKLWIDNILVYRIGDITMTDAEAEAILAEVTALDDAIYNADDKSALATAKGAFEENRTIDNYNALSAALVTAKNSVTVYTALNTAITNVEGWTSDATNVTDPIRARYTNGLFSDETKADDIYEEYQAAEIAALVDAEATNYTSAIINPSFETGNMTGWSAESRSDTGVKENSNGTYTINNGVDGSYIFNSWGGTSENNVYQTIKELPAGTYTLSALVAGFKDEELTVAVNETTNSVIVIDGKTTGYTVNVVFTLSEATDVVIKASNIKGADGSDASFIKADHFTLTVGDITTNDYTALNDAIAAAEAYTLGFDTDEYAPYNNVAAISALAAAKAVNQTVAMAQADLDAIVSALNNAIWTANTKEMNAVYDGTFANAENNGAPAGWTMSNNTLGGDYHSRAFVGDERLAEFNETNSAMYLRFDGTNSNRGSMYFYGNVEGYTMPLKANTTYYVKVDFAGWNSSGKPLRMNVTGPEGFTALSQEKTVANKADQSNETPQQFFIVFTTSAAGNYVINFQTPGDDSNAQAVVISNLELMKAKPVEVVIKDNFTATTYSSEYPLDFTGSDLTAYIIVDDKGTEQKVTKVPSGTGVYVTGNAGNYSVNVFDGTGADDVTDNKLVGTVDKTVELLSTDDVTYYMYGRQNGKGGFFKVGTTTERTASAHKAYLKLNIDSSNAKDIIVVGGAETDGISIMDALDNEKKTTYNLQGQEVNRTQRGVYIVNGKKVVLK